MKKHTNPAPVSDEQARTLLERYKCPIPFHEVRTRFFGNIATPAMSASPTKMVGDLWGGELPTFDSIDAANELMGALVMGLWNRLSYHQDRSSPFRLMRIDRPPTREGLAALALMRRQELDGFIEGLFGREEAVDFPERAHRCLDSLGEMRALFASVQDVVTDETKAATLKDMERESGNLEREFKMAEQSYGTDHLDLVLAKGYLAKLLGNARIVRYLAQHHRELLSEFQKIAELESTAA